MALTKLSKERVLRAIVWKATQDRDIISTVLELGAQKMSDKEYPVYASKFYRDELNMSYDCINLVAENNTFELNLGQLKKYIEDGRVFGLVTDFGASDYVKNLYQCWKTIHELCKAGGMIICENAEVGSGDGHYSNYRTRKFYEQLAKAMDYQVIEIIKETSLEIFRWKVCCILKKLSDKPFINKTKFNKFDFKCQKNKK